jgi:adenine-specific DNA-methyltransferase
MKNYKLDSKYLGQVFTNKRIVKLILNKVNFTINIYNKKILEPSCGNGNFLIEIVKRIIKDCRNNNIQNIEELLNKNVYGWDIDERNIEATKIRLNLFLSKLRMNKIEWKNIKVLNSINKENIIEYKNYFDFVVGNPPYILYKNLDKENKKYLLEWEWSKGNIQNNIFVCFIELAFLLLKQSGEIGYIIPRTLFSSIYTKMKLFFQTNLYIKDIIDFKNEKIFNNADIATLILLANKQNNNNLEYINSFYKTEYFDKSLTKLTDICTITYILRTNNNKLFIQSIKNTNFIIYNNKKYEIEPELLRECNKSKNRKVKLLFPYHIINGIYRLMQLSYIEQYYPLFYNFLKDEKITNYKYDRQTLTNYLNLKDKIICDSFLNSNNSIFYIPDNYTDIIINGFYIYPKNKNVDFNKLFLELNSNNIKEYILKFANKLNDNYIGMSVDLINNIRVDYNKIKKDDVIELFIY